MMKKITIVHTCLILVTLSLFLFSLLFTLTGCGMERENTTPFTEADTHICEDDYCFYLEMPPENKSYRPTDPPPVFSWKLASGFPQTYVVEIDFLHDGSYLTETVSSRTNYLLSETTWKMIVDNAPQQYGLQKILWRIRADYSYCTHKEPFYAGWSYFWIDSAGASLAETPSDTDPTATKYYRCDTLVFALDSDNTFAYFNIYGDREVYRKGEYLVTDDTIELQFKENGEVVESVFCNRSGEDRFTYDWAEYVRVSGQ